MSLLLRPLEVDDLGVLEALDVAYAGRHGLAPVVGAASLAFYARSGHAFLAQASEAPTGSAVGSAVGSAAGSAVGSAAGSAAGFALAQAVWDGARPTVRLVRLVGADAARRALAEAVVKSAYDAAVYALVAEVPTTDTELAELLASGGWGERPTRRFERLLGSAARSAA
jgi:hypothetical protein